MNQSVYLAGVEDFVNTDQQLTYQVASGLAKFPGLKGLEISVHQGRVTLSGHVRSFHEKQIAICLSRKIDGIYGLEDQIEVIE